MEGLTMTNVEVTPGSLALARLPNVLALSSAALFVLATRFFSEGLAQNIALGVAVLSLLAAGALRLMARVRDQRPGAARYTLLASGADALVLVGGLLVFFTEKESLPLALGVGMLVIGAALLFAIELVAIEMRAAGAIDTRRVVTAVRTAATMSFAIAALVGLNYGVDALDLRRDFAFAAPSSPSAATRSLFESVQCGEEKQKPEVFLFFERGNTAYAEVKDYFEGLTALGARTTLQDQALDPVLAKELKVSKNGVVALRCGARNESYTIGADREDAAKKLKKLDEEIRTKLAKITRDPQNVYVTVGHGERSLDDAAKDKERTSAKGLKKLIESTNAKIKKLGIAEGLTKAVPDDAALVVVAGPTEAFLAEEAVALRQYVERGGSLLLLLDPVVAGGVDVQSSLEPLLAGLGVKVGTHEVLNDKEYVQKTNTNADWAFLFSTSFGSHKSVKTLSGARGKAAVLFGSAAHVDKRADTGAAKVSLLARTRPASFIDANDSRTFDEGSEARALLDLAAAVEVPGTKEGRALVVGDSDGLADGLLANQANAVFGYEALLWLLRDDDKTAEGVQVEDDVEILHTRDEDKLWFYGTVLAGPVLVLALGMFSVSRRRRRSSRGAA
jgi:ABC-type uncharacterized transport system